MGKRPDRGKPLVNVKLYVEGGGHRNTLRRECRAGFREFLEKAGLKGNMPTIVACGSRNDAYNKFSKEKSGNNEIAMLLVDSEGPVADPATDAQPWRHLNSHDRWERPARASDAQCHLMVQTMESWFLADRQTLGDYYGQGFRASALPADPNIEQVAKQAVDAGIAAATRSAAKGRYSKSKHSFDLLAKIDPAKVTNASPYAQRFIDALHP